MIHNGLQKLKHYFDDLRWYILFLIERVFSPVCSAGRVPTTELVNRIFAFCELYSGKTLYPYQERFSKRVIRSVLDNDGEEITALFSRQSGKSETIAVTVGGLMIILPELANMPMFADDPRLTMFKEGVKVGVFAPSQRQAQITYNRIKTRLQCDTAIEVLNDPEFRLEFTTSNGQTCALSNGSFVTSISASDGSNIEGESFMVIICEECQDISNFKIRKSIHPMGAAYNATIVKIGTATTFKGDFYDAIQRNKREDEQKKSHIKNHFEFDYRVAAKYNPKYAKYVESEKKRLGENSDEFRMAYCVSPDTRILTSDLKWVQAKFIKAGDSLVGFDENPPKKNGQRKFKNTLVEDVGCIERPCYKLKFEDGTSIVCSEEHQWLVFTAGSRTQWVKTKDLKPTDRIYKVCNVWDSTEPDYRIGYLSAAFDGEGCISHDSGHKLSQVCFAQRDNIMLCKVKQYLTDFGFTFGCQIDSKGVHKLYLTGGKYEIIRFLGLIRPERLLGKFDANLLGTVRCCNYEDRGFYHPHVVSKEYVGVQEVIPIRTSSRTFVAEGLASHNCLEWIIERGMFVDIEKFEKNNTEFLLERVMEDHTANHVIGIDLGGKGDDTILTPVEVDWDMPVIQETRQDEETGEEIVYTAYNTYLKDWMCISNCPDYEEQYPLIMDYISHFRVARVVCDATREASVAHRLRANLNCEVIPYIFTTKSKSEMYKHLLKEIDSGRARVCGGEQTQATREYLDFMEQLGELEKGWSGTHMVVSHPDEKGAHDDYPDSWALAVWGASFEGEVNTAETGNTNKFTEKTRAESVFYKARNKMTARRRR